MSETPQVEVARIVMVRDGEGVDYIAGAEDWLSLLDNAAVASILHSAAAELAELADTFGPYDEGDAAPVIELVPARKEGGDGAADRDGPTAAPTMAAQLDAMNGGPLAPLTPDQAELFKKVSAWYLARCAELADRGVVPPQNILLCVLACANEVVSYNQALAEQARRDATDAERPLDEPTRH